MRARHMATVLLDGQRYALGRGVLLKVSFASLVCVLLKDFTFHMWHFAMKRDRDFFISQLNPERRKILERDEGEDKPWWERLRCLMWVFSQVGDDLPKRVNINAVIEIDCQELLSKENDTFP